jgi:hypothetical protein
MKLAFLCYGCDGSGAYCGEESTVATTFTEATKLARRDGWFIRTTRDDPLHLCPKHRAEAA